MRKVMAIASIAVRNAIRSRVVLVLLCLLMLFIFGLPLTIRGDGTLSGFVQIVLSYTMGFTGLLLSIATVWAGCAAVSAEVEGKQIHLVVTKPVHRVQIWFGKWLGLLFVNAVLLLCCGVVVYGMLRYTTRPSQLTPEDRQILQEEILLARRVALPAGATLEERARQMLDERIIAEGLPPEYTEAQALEELKKYLLNRDHTVGPGESKQWVYDGRHLAETTVPHLLRFRFSTSQIGPGTVMSRWQVSFRDDQVFVHKDEFDADRRHSLSVPADVIGQGETLTVQFENLGEQAVTVFFSPKNGVQVLTYEGTFVMNLARTLLLVFFQLAFLGAVGLTAGTLFSMPVAALTSLYVIILLKAAPFIQKMAGQDIIFVHAHGPIRTEPGIIDAIFQTFFRLMNTVMQPLQSPNVYEFLANGQLVSWSLVGEAFVVRAVLYSGCLALLGAWLFSRREIAAQG